MVVGRSCWSTVALSYTSTRSITSVWLNFAFSLKWEHKQNLVYEIFKLKLTAHNQQRNLERLFHCTLACFFFFCRNHLHQIFFYKNDLIAKPTIHQTLPNQATKVRFNEWWPLQSDHFYKKKKVHSSTKFLHKKHQLDRVVFFFNCAFSNNFYHK